MIITMFGVHIQILPLPSDITISSDERNGEDSNSNTNTLLRGTSEWAPPRPQIIFTPHPPPVYVKYKL